MNSAGSWVDDVMAPLAGRLSGAAYNRIYEAVERGTRAQGERLVRDLRAALAAAAEREARYRGELRLLVEAAEDFVNGANRVAEPARIQARIADAKRALSPTPTEPQK